jgi:hypothetical protein
MGMDIKNGFEPQRRQIDVTMAELRIQMSTVIQQVSVLATTAVPRQEMELLERAAALEHANIRAEIAANVKLSELEHSAIRATLAADLTTSTTEHTELRKNIATLLTAVANLTDETRKTIVEEHAEGEKEHDKLWRATNRNYTLIWALLITALVSSLGIIGALIYQINTHKVLGG